MAESTLSLTYTDLLRSVAVLMGYDDDAVVADASALATANGKECDRYVQDGYAQFLTPPRIQDERESYIWSFLTAYGSLSLTVAGGYDYDAPDDFGSLAEPMTYAPTSVVRGPELRDEGLIRNLRTQSAATGQPTLMAVRVKAATLTGGQRWEFLFWPTPDATYTLTYPYNVLAGELTATNLYPLGGSLHGRTIRQFARAKAELLGLRVSKGPEYEEAMSLLESSISADRRLAPARFRRDNADGLDSFQRVSSVTYHGVWPT